MTALVILTIGVIGGALAAALSLSRRSAADVIDPQAEERWLVKAVAHRPKLAAFVRRRLDRTRAGGLLLTLGFFVVTGLATFAGWVFDTLDQSSGFARFDEAVAEFGARRADGARGFLEFVTDLGGTGFVVVFSVVLALYGWWGLRNRHVPLFVIAVAAGQALVNNGLKLLIDRDRPGIAQLTDWAGSSFPSGHSAAAAATFAAAALVLGIRRSRTSRALLTGSATLLALTVGATRALLGVHWLTDVLAGLAVGWAWFTVCAVAFGGRLMTFGEPRDEVDVEVAAADAAA